MEDASGRILIVDDDAALRKLMNAYLSRLGYSVDPCSGAEECLQLVAADPSRYTIALVDVNMPGMGGKELARRLVACNPGIRLVLLSGYPAALSGLEVPEGGRLRFLVKPFAPQELADALA